MKEKLILYTKIIVNGLLCLVGLAAVIFLLPKLLIFFLPFVIALFISMIANPLVNFLEKRVKIMRKHSTAIIIVLVIAVILALLYGIGFLLVREGIKLSKELPDILATFQAFLEEVAVALADLTEKMPDSIHLFFVNLDDNLEEWFSKAVNGSFSLPTLSVAGSYVSSAANVLLMTIITILASYFIISDRNRLEPMMTKIMPESVRKTAQLVKQTIKASVGGYFKAQFKIMLILILIMFIFFEIMDVRYSFLIALLTALLDFLPVFGTGAVLGPWAVVELITKDYLRAVLLVVLYLVCLLLKQLLQPKMVGDSIGVPALAALLFMFIGYRLGGLLGMIIGIPVGMLLISFYRAGVFDRLIRGFQIIIHDINEFRKF